MESPGVAPVVGNGTRPAPDVAAADASGEAASHGHAKLTRRTSVGLSKLHAKKEAGHLGNVGSKITQGATAIVDFKTDQFEDAELAAERQRERDAYEHQKTCSAEALSMGDCQSTIWCATA